MIKAQFKAMVRDTIVKEVRSKTLVFIFIATTLAIFLAHALLKMFMQNADGSANVMVSGANSLSIMFSFINMWSVIIAGIFGISSIRSDFQDKIIYQYLAFPISRTQYMLSRIFGTWILVFSYYLYSYLLSAILFSIATHSIALHWNHLLSMLLMGMYVFIIIFISFMYSLVADKIAAFLLLLVTVACISASNGTFRTLSVGEYFSNFSIFKLIGLLIYSVLPRVNYLTELASAVMVGDKINLNVGLEALHLIVTTAFFIFIADKIIKRKNF